ncbi:MAG: secretin and TonB N-terminal domain-containing protein [Alphaproteobacteria bacterium]|nr:secretin and TonB N-terminal domain-containing protein [Alphaproteobacteria bacterium]
MNLLLAALLSSSSPAAELVLAVGPDGEVVQAAPTAPPISIDVVDADIRSVLRLFGEHAGVNFVLDDSVQGRVTATLKDVPWDQALAAILLTQGLGAVPMTYEQDAAVWVVEPLQAR